MNEFNIVVKAAGSQAELAALLGVTRQTVCGWRTRGIPVHRAPQIQRLLGVPMEQVRPDVFGPEQPQAIKQLRDVLA